MVGSREISDDREVLLDLFWATNGPSWKEGAVWNVDSSISDWHGVKVDSSGRVIELELISLGLEGGSHRMFSSHTGGDKIAQHRYHLAEKYLRRGNFCWSATRCRFKLFTAMTWDGRLESRCSCSPFREGAVSIFTVVRCS